MPVTTSALPNGLYRVSTPNEIHAKGTTKKKAASQAKLLNAVDHGWKPGKKVSPNTPPKMGRKPPGAACKSC